MNEFTSGVLFYMGIYALIILMCLMAINFFMGGFFFPWLKVKTSRGKLILVRIRTIVHDYYKPGLVDKGFLVFKDREKEERRLSVEEGTVYRAAGVNNIDVHDEKNCVVKHDFSAVSGFDAVKYTYLYLRALFRPEMVQKELRIILVLCVLILIGVAACIYLGISISDQLLALKTAPTAAGQSMASGGV